MENKIVASIIVPVYNRERTIETCLKSILSCREKNIEIIVVDDGSTDLSGKIIKNLALKDERIKYIYQENSGVSVARNKGLDLVQGKWVTFCDSDDCVDSSMFDVLSLDENCDLFVMEHSAKSAEDIDFKTQSKKKKISYKKIENNCAEYMFGEYSPYRKPVFSVWAKLFRTYLIQENNIRFNTNYDLGEDQIFICEYLSYVKSLCDCHFISYYILNWKKLHHLGSYLRTPENFLHNQKGNFESLNKLYKITGGVQCIITA